MKLSTLNGKLTLGSVSTNAKTIKSDARGDSLTYIIYLAPSHASGYDTCPSASDACRNVCLGLYAGRSVFSNVQQARIRKTKLYFEDKPTFIAQLLADLKLFQAYCIQEDKQGYVRINGSSDLKIEDDGVLEHFPDLRFYDYTKRLDRDFKSLPPNYHLTFSRDERSTEAQLRSLIPCVNVAVVFDELPDTYLGYPVVNGDKDDLRPLDGSNVIVGLKAKGTRCKQDTSGFVVHTKKEL